VVDAECEPRGLGGGVSGKPPDDGFGRWLLAFRRPGNTRQRCRRSRGLSAIRGGWLSGLFFVDLFSGRGVQKGMEDTGLNTGGGSPGSCTRSLAPIETAGGLFCLLDPGRQRGQCCDCGLRLSLLRPFVSGGGHW
jgi:hypothetical protein